MVTVAESASLTINGINVAAGPGMVLLANPSMSLAGLQQDDYLAQTYQVNPMTTITSLDLGKISLGRLLWIQCNVPIEVTVTQNAVDRTHIVDSFLVLNGQFTAVKLANTSATAIANVAVVVTGDRPDPSGPGIF